MPGSPLLSLQHSPHPPWPGLLLQTACGLAAPLSYTILLDCKQGLIGPAQGKWGWVGTVRPGKAEGSRKWSIEASGLQAWTQDQCSSAFALPWSRMPGFHHSFVCLISRWWVLAACPGMSVLASSPPSASPFNSEPTISCPQSLVSQLRLRGECLREPGLTDWTPSHSRPRRPSLALHALAPVKQLAIMEVLHCGHPPLPETHSPCTRCPGPVLKEPQTILLMGSDSFWPCFLTALITALIK